MELKTKKDLSDLVCPQKNRKFGDCDRCTIASYEKKHERFTQNFSNQKILNILCTIYSLSFNGKQFLFFVERGKISSKN
jgi:hypothetical protein